MNSPAVLSFKKARLKPWISSETKEKLIHGFFFCNGLVTVIVLAGIFCLLLTTALPAFRELKVLAFLTGKEWDPTSYTVSKYGILPMVVSTFMVTIGSLLLAIPIGIGSAAYLADIAGYRTREIVKPIIEMLASIPSVVIGFLGIVLVSPILAKVTGQYNGLNAVNGSILLAVMALPTIISISEDALNSVPSVYSQASLALGASKWQTIIRVKIPAAASGILAACMLGMGRAIGETMTVLMACGNAPAMPESFLGPIRTLTATVAIELGEVAYNTTHYYALFALGLILFCMTFVVNLISDIFLHRFEKVNR